MKKSCRALSRYSNFEPGVEARPSAALRCGAAPTQTNYVLTFLYLIVVFLAHYKSNLNNHIDIENRNMKFKVCCHRAGLDSSVVRSHLPHREWRGETNPNRDCSYTLVYIYCSVTSDEGAGRLHAEFTIQHTAAIRDYDLL